MNNIINILYKLILKYYLVNILNNIYLLFQKVIIR